MNGFALLLGHLVGDYIFQNDWMAKNKTNPLDRTDPGINSWDEIVGAYKTEREGHLACTVHCLLYTFAIRLFTFSWIPWWGLLACFVIHWPVDRFRLAKWWMEHISGQKEFANGLLAPWSVIVVDNTFHLLTLYLIWIATEWFK